MAGVDLKERFKADLRRHPRVVHQNLLDDSAARQQVADALPDFLPFKGKAYAGALWVADWDHRLPSRVIAVRLYAFYEKNTQAVGESSLQDRLALIARDDLFPEFDVPDLGGLVADEAYEAEVELGKDPPTKYRLASPWRRDIDETKGRKAEAVVRDSDSYKKLLAETRNRPLGLGDLEAAEWVPPCESGHSRWGIEVWFLRSFNGMVGEGTAFLVDLDDKAVISQRDFQFRAG